MYIYMHVLLDVLICSHAHAHIQHKECCVHKVHGTKGIYSVVQWTFRLPVVKCDVALNSKHSQLECVPELQTKVIHFHFKSSEYS